MCILTKTFFLKSIDKHGNLCYNIDTIKKGATIMLTVKTTNSTTYPLEISEKGRFHKVNIHHFLLEDDDDWEDFINQLNFYRERYLDGSLEQLKKNIKKSKNT